MASVGRTDLVPFAEHASSSSEIASSQWRSFGWGARRRPLPSGRSARAVKVRVYPTRRRGRARGTPLQKSGRLSSRFLTGHSWPGGFLGGLSSVATGALGAGPEELTARCSRGRIALDRAGHGRRYNPGPGCIPGCSAVVAPLVNEIDVLLTEAGILRVIFARLGEGDERPVRRGFHHRDPEGVITVGARTIDVDVSQDRSAEARREGATGEGRDEEGKRQGGKSAYRTNQRIAWRRSLRLNFKV